MTEEKKCPVCDGPIEPRLIVCIVCFNKLGTGLRRDVARVARSISRNRGQMVTIVVSRVKEHLREISVSSAVPS